MANYPAYDAAAARADKLLEPDGSVQTASGTTVLPADPTRAQAYSNAAWRADKLLEPNGSVVTSGGSGTATPPGGSTGQIQYNNNGVFAGSGATVDATGNLNVVGNITASIGTALIGPSPQSGSSNSFANVSGKEIDAVDFGTGVKIWYGLSANNFVNFITTHATGGLVVNMGSGTNQGVQLNSSLLAIGPSTSNGVTVNSVAAGSTPSITATGTDTNMSLQLAAKGTGVIDLRSSTVYASQIQQAVNISSSGVSLTLQPGTSWTLKLGGSTTMFSGGGVVADVNATISTGSGYTALRISPFESSVGATGKLLLDLGTNTAAAGGGTHTSKFSVTSAGVVQCAGVLITPVYTVATLPAASAALQGARALVTDATAPTFLGTLTGGGAVITPVFCTGSAWLAG